DISELKIFDVGDIEIPVGDSAAVLTAIRREYSRLTHENASLVTLGGEHLISLPLVQIMHEKYGDDLFVVQFDAHADLRTDYLGVEFSHATVMHHVSSLLGVDNTAAIGIRSGSRDEWERLRSHPNYFGGVSGRAEDEIGAFAKTLTGRKLYITCDLDVFDPGIMPGTGTPEPGGISFRDFISLVHNFEDCDIIGADIVELAPDYDSSGISSALAATVLREILLVMEK
ncbi:agmatinase, partial [Candidatus Omnitrophota bacterium]